MNMKYLGECKTQTQYHHPGLMIGTIDMDGQTCLRSAVNRYINGAWKRLLVSEMCSETH